MDITNYEYDAKKICDFLHEDRNNHINASWFAHHAPDPLIFNKATEEEFKLLLPVTPDHKESATHRKVLKVEHGRSDKTNAEQEVVPSFEAARDEEEEQVVRGTTGNKDDTALLPENIELRPSKATYPPRLKHQSVFDRLRAHTASSVGKLSKQTVIQKKHPPLYKKKSLKKKLVLQERRSPRLTTNDSTNNKQSQGPEASQDKASIPHYMLPTTSYSKQVSSKTLGRSKKQASSKTPAHSRKQAPPKTPVKKFTPYTITTTTSLDTSKKRQRSTPPHTSKLPHYMQPTKQSILRSKKS